MVGRINAMIEQEIGQYDPEAESGERHGAVGTPLPAEWHRKMLADFRASLIEPEKVAVCMNGNGTRECWSITRPTNNCRIVYVPEQAEFSLCRETENGLVDINVHGDAIGCFGAI